MDPGPESHALDSIIISGLGCATGLPCTSERYLKVPKSRKFMGGQDHLAVCAAGRALESAGLTPADLGPNAGLFLCVGYIPFERKDIDALIGGSLDEGRISMKRFGTDGFAAVNPLLTFRCLPNMPAYHISACFDIQGEYFVTYPGSGQFYIALEEALFALQSGRIEIAVVGAVADQTNFLVSHHFQRVRPPMLSENLRDGAGFLILQRRTEKSSATIRGSLTDLALQYAPHNPFEQERPCSEQFIGCAAPQGDFGTASLPVTLASAGRTTIRHELRSRDGISARSAWELL